MRCAAMFARIPTGTSGGRRRSWSSRRRRRPPASRRPMRRTTLLGVALAALPLGACEQTVFLNYDGSVPVDSGSFPTCNGTTIQPKQIETLEIIVAMDRSMGMSAAKFGDTTALASARDAIDQYAALNQNVMHFGYVE